MSIIIKNIWFLLIGKYYKYVFILAYENTLSLSRSLNSIEGLLDIGKFGIIFLCHVVGTWNLKL